MSKAQTTKVYFSAVGWNLPPSPLSISIGKGGSTILYPTPVGFPLGIAASAILSTGDYRTEDYRTGDYRIHRSRIRNTHLKKWVSGN